MDESLRPEARRALGLALDLAERSLDFMFPTPSVQQGQGGAPQVLHFPACGGGQPHIPGYGFPPQQPVAHHQGSHFPSTAHGLGCGAAAAPVVQIGPPPTGPPPAVAAATVLPKANPLPAAPPRATARGSGVGDAAGMVRQARSRSRVRRGRCQESGHERRRRAPDRPPVQVNHGARAAARPRQPAPMRDDERPAARSSGARPVFRGEPAAAAAPLSSPRPSSRPGGGVDRSGPVRAQRVPVGLQEPVGVVNPRALTMAAPAGLYLRGLRRGISVDSVRRLYESMATVSPTLLSLPQNFFMHQYPSGAALVSHPAFSSRALVAQVLRELGAGVPTSEGQLVVRQAREVDDIQDE